MKIFVVDDDAWYGEMMAYQLEMNPDDEVIRFSDGQSCLDALYQKPQVITLDYEMPKLSGQEVLQRIKKTFPEIAVIILSAQEDVNIAVELLKLADDYVVKNDEAIPRVRHAINKLRERQMLVEEIDHLQQEVGKKYDFGNIIKGKSASIQKIFKLLGKAAASQITVSITGETGTGKELAAKAIHYHSARKKNAFVAVNVAAIPKELIESELFGHEKGAFTGAAERRIGKFEEASKGTLFLDEIGEMDLPMQSKLLRVLQEREVTRIGGNKVIKVDFRLIIATHKKLSEEVRKGNFREDLYYRLLGLSVELPALKERKEDIIELANFFLQEYSKANKEKVKSLSPEARKKLLNYSFPGNIRELRAIMDLAAIMADETEISSEDIIFPEHEPISTLLEEQTTLRGYTIRIIKHFLELYEGNFDKVAERLDMGKSTLYKMRKDGEI